MVPNCIYLIKVMLFKLSCQLKCKFLDTQISDLDTPHMEISK